MQESLAGIVQDAPWTFAIGLFALSVLLYSQAATVAALMSLGFSLGIDPLYLIAMFLAVNGYFFLPTYGTIVAAIEFDSTGTTRIGRYVLNHSFMRPGLVASVGAVGAGFALVMLYRATGLIGGATGGRVPCGARPRASRPASRGSSCRRDEGVRRDDGLRRIPELSPVGRVRALQWAVGPRRATATWTSRASTTSPIASSSSARTVSPGTIAGVGAGSIGSALVLLCRAIGLIG